MTDSSELPGGARLMVGFDGKEASTELQDVLQSTGARSVILFARNIDSAAQARELIAAVRSLVKWPILVAVDQEGGPVVRVTEGATVFPGNMALGACADEGLARRQGEVSGRELASMGFDLNLAPVVDLQTDPRNPGIGIRSLGAARDAAAPLARALIEGHAQSDVACCLKHFPGKGAALVDAHHDLPVLGLSLDEFREPHVAIFEELLDTDARLAVMTTHIIVRGLDPDLPATLSPRVVRDLLRDELGFDGLVITDDLEMGAIVKHWGVDEAAVLAAAAGHDLLPICHSSERQRAAARALDRALEDGRLDRADHVRSVARIERHAAPRPQAPADVPVSDVDLAREIARRGLHVFGDARGLLPIDGNAVVLAAAPHAVALVEELARGGWAENVRGCFTSGGLAVRDVVELDPTACDTTLLERAGAGDRVVLLSWDALRLECMRELLAAACRTLQDRLVVVHLRNPFDQALVPDDVTAATAFGYRQCQLEAISEVLSGRVAASGRLPAPVRPPRR